MDAFRAEAEGLVTSRALGYDQKLRRLATLADNALPYPGLSPLCAEALEARVICDMFEGNRPFTPRYVLPDYALALRQGVAYLELEPPTTLDDALSFLTILYSQVPSVTTYPVYLGDLDALLEPFVPTELPDAELDAKLRRFWIQLDRMLPDAFVHANVGPGDGRVVRAIWRVERSLRQVVPNLTLKVSPETPDDLIRDAVETVFVTGKPHVVNHPMMVADHGDEYAVVSCYNSLKVRGGAHSLVRLNLKEAVTRHVGGIDAFCAEALPHWVELTAELGEARIRSLVEQQGFFESNFLATEGLVDLDRFSLMFGIFGLAECVNELMAREDVDARYGHDARANEASWRVTRRIAELVAARPLPYCGGGAGFAYLHSQSGIDLDLETTAGTRIPIGDEPGLREHITACAPHHALFAAGISDIFHVDETVQANPQAMVDVIRGAFEVGMRDFTFNLDSNEFIRITGYLVRKSDLVGVDEHGARHSSDYLAATAEVNHTVTTRAIKRVIAAELSPQA
ncbi:MAG: YjjI family glycine radical enzyme [Propionicimonas sp.]|uniref:YjjI family glycine radical enzyme n=1 Tax=Propionicimonas sp. TaxID=1955623 RepID=UPI003D149352